MRGGEYVAHFGVNIIYEHRLAVYYVLHVK